MKYILIILALLGTNLNIQAQQEKAARKVLDKTASILKNSGDMKLDFTLSTFNNSQEDPNATSGTMCLSGNRFVIESPAMKAWFDGQTQWSMLSSNNEVNVSNPTEEELQAINPYTFIHLYKEGYNYSMKQKMLRGKEINEVTLQASRPDVAFPVMLLDIEKNSHIPICVRFFNGQNWIRITIHNLKTGLKFDDKKFRFDTTQHPDLEVIDLR